MIIGEGENGEPVEVDDDEDWIDGDAYGEFFEPPPEDGPPGGYEARFLDELHLLLTHPIADLGEICTGKTNALMQWHPGEHDVLPAVPRRGPGKSSWASVMFERIVRGGRTS